MIRLRAFFGFCLFVSTSTAAAIVHAEPPAKELFGAKATPAPLAARAIGGYARGCLAGGVALPVDGNALQAMRLSRNRNWGHPQLVRLVERLALEAKEKDGWPGLLVGDLAQPRGGPMLTGHASHQVGLDADIWLTPMPSHRLSAKEREELSAVSMIKDPFTINPDVWTPGHVKLLKRAASYPEVARIFVHPAIKKALCEAAGSDRKWLEKVRPYWGHHYHFHVRIDCPKGSTNCENQPEVGGGDGCGKEVEDWFALLRKPPSDKPVKPKPPLMMANLPAECRTVVNAPDAEPPSAKKETLSKAPDAKADDQPSTNPQQASTLPSATDQKKSVPLPQRRPQ